MLIARYTLMTARKILLLTTAVSSCNFSHGSNKASICKFKN